MKFLPISIVSAVEGRTYDISNVAILLDLKATEIKSSVGLILIVMIADFLSAVHFLCSMNPEISDFPSPSSYLTHKANYPCILPTINPLEKAAIACIET